MTADNQNALLLERDEEVRKIYSRIINESGINKKFLTYKFIIAQIEKSGAPRFYISGKHAQNLVSAYYNDKLMPMSKRRHAMVEDLVQCYEAVHDKWNDLKKADMWEKVVACPAKSFYLSPARIREIIYQYHDRKMVKK